MLNRKSFRRLSTIIVGVSCLGGSATAQTPSVALPPPAPLTEATLRALQGEQSAVSNLRRADFIRATYLPLALVLDSNPTRLQAWLREAAETGFTTVIVPALDWGHLLLDPGNSLSARTLPGMVRTSADGQTLSPLARVQAALARDDQQTSGCCPSKKIQVWVSIALGSLDVGSPEALDPRHPVRTQAQVLRSTTPGADGTLLYNVASPVYVDTINLVMAELAGNPAVSGILLTDLQTDVWPTPVLERLLVRLSTTAHQMAPTKPIALHTSGGSLPWTGEGSLLRLASRLQRGAFTHWFHGTAEDEPGEAASLQAALKSPIPVTLEVTLSPGAPRSVPAAQSLQAVTDSRFQGLSVRSSSTQGVQKEDLRAFRSLLDAERVEQRMSAMAQKAGAFLQAPSQAMGTPQPVPVSQLDLPPLPRMDLNLAAPTGSGKPDESFLNRLLDSAVKNSSAEAPENAQSAPEPLSAAGNADPSTQPAPALPPALAPNPGDEPQAPLASATVATEQPTAAVPQLPRAPEPIRANPPATARIPAPWTGLRATAHATEDDITAFQDATSRRPQPSSSVEFVKINHDDTDSPLAPVNRNREFIDYAGQARGEAAKAEPQTSDAPLMQLTTTTGRTFTGRASLQGSLWRVELPSGAVINLPTSRILSAEVAPGAIQ
jgi:hypothetical protein